jgi:hypothetical protein
MRQNYGKQHTPAITFQFPSDACLIFIGKIVFFVYIEIITRKRRTNVWHGSRFTVEQIEEGISNLHNCEPLNREPCPIYL